VRISRATLPLGALLGILTGCAPKANVLPAAGAPLDVVVVPGCPATPDGHLSPCQWRRAIWAAHLYETGAARRFVTSGGAAYTPYVEATALAAGMEALGVPASAITRETQALHTDQNTSYSLALVEQLSLGQTVGMASDRGHAQGMCSMAKRWGWGCAALPLDTRVVADRMAEPLPDLLLEPIPREAWIGAHREPRMATNKGYTSIGHYTRVLVSAITKGYHPPPPPGPEPTLPD
jgi:DUF218 domain